MSLGPETLCAFCGMKFRPHRLSKSRKTRKRFCSFDCAKKEERLIPLSQVGKRFASLTILSLGVHPKKFLCRCDCGVEKEIFRASVCSGDTRSCGCKRRKLLSESNTKHGMWKSSEYMAHSSMIQRCENPNNCNWPHYGARGITVCDSWKNSFEAFYADMGPKPKGHSIERIDVNGNYEPGNCKWATAKEQGNNKRNTPFLEHNGERLTIQEWAEKLGVKYSLIWTRISRGWTIERTLNVDKVG